MAYSDGRPGWPPGTRQRRRSPGCPSNGPPARRRAFPRRLRDRDAPALGILLPAVQRRELPRPVQPDLDRCADRDRGDGRPVQRQVAAAAAPPGLPGHVRMDPVGRRDLLLHAPSSTPSSTSTSCSSSCPSRSASGSSCGSGSCGSRRHSRPTRRTWPARATTRSRSSPTPRRRSGPKRAARSRTARTQRRRR